MSRKLFRLVAAVVIANGVIATTTKATAEGSAQQSLSVLVTLTKVQKGSLPRSVAAFGSVETNAAARHTIMAPGSAVVNDVYVKAGEEVAKGAALVQLGPSPATAAAYTKALAALRAARELVQRTQSLLGQHLATRQNLANAEKLVSEAQASVSALKAEGAGSPQTLAAPYHAIVTKVSATPGAIVSQGAALLDLIRRSGLVLRTGVVPDSAIDIQAGNEAKITALGGSSTISGTVLFRGSMVNPQTGLVSVDIKLPKGSLIPGQRAKADIITGKVNGYIVPHEAILVNDSGSPYVVQAANGTAREVPVQVLLSIGARDVVSGPIDPRASLVLAGNYQLKNGMKIRTADPSTTGNK